MCKPTNSTNLVASTIDMYCSRADNQKDGKMLVLNDDCLRVRSLLGQGSFSRVFAVEVLSITRDEASLVSEADEKMTSPWDARFGLNMSSDHWSPFYSERDGDIATMESSTRSSNSDSCDPYIPKGSAKSLSQKATPRYALKRLRQDLKGGDEEEHGAAPCDSALSIALHDFVNEARLLTQLPPHENIIKLRGVSEHLVADDKNLGSVDDFVLADTASLAVEEAEPFILLERLEETLQSRLKRWEIRDRRPLHPTNPSERLWRSKASRQHECSVIKADQCYRIRAAALGISRAMHHLHKHQVIFRDLKSANCGFDSTGTAKLFDFGLAKCIQKNHNQASCDADGDRRMTGAVGTSLYMSPEVALSKDYGLSADVYSFAMLLWQIVTLRRPFDRCKRFRDWYKAAVQRNQRPPLKSIVSKELKLLIESCWDVDPDVRPSFALITAQLEREGQDYGVCYEMP